MMEVGKRQVSTQTARGADFDPEIDSRAVHWKLEQIEYIFIVRMYYASRTYYYSI